MLCRARELIWEQNRIGEEQAPGATEQLHAINRELTLNMDKILTEVADAPKFLSIAQEWILQLYEVEKEAIELLQNVST